MRWTFCRAAIPLMLSLVSIHSAAAQWQVGLHSGWRWERGGTAIGQTAGGWHTTRLAPQVGRQWRLGDARVRWQLAPAVEWPDRGSALRRLSSEVEVVPGSRLAGWTLRTQVQRLQFDRPTRWRGRTRLRLGIRRQGRAAAGVSLAGRYDVDVVTYDRLSGAPRREERRQAARLTATSREQGRWISLAATGRLAESSLDEYDRLGVELMAGAGWHHRRTTVSLQGAREWRRYDGGDIWQLGWVSATLDRSLGDGLGLFAGLQRQIGQTDEDREVFTPWSMVEVGLRWTWPRDSSQRAGRTRARLPQFPAPAEAGWVFRCHAPEAQTVHLVGSFNLWSQTAHPMTRGANDTWQTTVSLSSGVHEYAYLIDGKIWRMPPGATAYVEDGFGSRNGVLVVHPRAEDE